MSKTAGPLDWARMLALGALTVGLYLALFMNEASVLEISRRGHWWFLVPVAIAFLFSFVHGAFTGLFWDVLGIKAKKQEKGA